MRSEHSQPDTAGDRQTEAPEAVQLEDLMAGAGDAVSPGSDLGPCLYLGPRGERCNRRAHDRGFCALHQPGRIAAAFSNPSRILAAVLTIAVLLWPYVSDLVREIIRWMATR
ncbi:MAG TPA: hypothetical protein VJO53_14370 [Candidatus Acidoferrales bacterium]|nr:hypothetical protein [Candidatus Acidoferrales bacterium]